MRLKKVKKSGTAEVHAQSASPLFVLPPAGLFGAYCRLTHVHTCQSSSEMAFLNSLMYVTLNKTAEAQYGGTDIQACGLRVPCHKGNTDALVYIVAVYYRHFYWTKAAQIRTVCWMVTFEDQDRMKLCQNL